MHLAVVHRVLNCVACGGRLGIDSQRDIYAIPLSDLPFRRRHSAVSETLDTGEYDGVHALYRVGVEQELLGQVRCTSGII